jgi:hypothetical protein
VLEQIGRIQFEPAAPRPDQRAGRPAVLVLVGEGDGSRKRGKGLLTGKEKAGAAPRRIPAFDSVFTDLSRIVTSRHAVKHGDRGRTMGAALRRRTGA